MNAPGSPHASQSLWAELCLAVPGFVGHQARAALAKRSADLPRAFFHYAEDGDRTLNGPPLIRILANGHSVRVLGITADGALLLLKHASAVARAFDIGAKPWTLREGSLRAIPLAWPRHYRADAFVVSLPAGTREAARTGRFDDPALLAIVGTRLRDALVRQAAFIGVDLNTASIENLTISRSTAVKAKAGRYFAALDVDFTLASNLIGPWQIGRLQARGYGRLHAVRPQARLLLPEIAA